MLSLSHNVFYLQPSGGDISPTHQTNHTYIKRCLCSFYAAPDHQHAISGDGLPGVGPVQPFHQSTVHIYLQPEGGDTECQLVPLTVP